MSSDQPSFLRYVTGFAAGGVVAAASTALTFLAFVEVPAKTSPSRHDVMGVLALLVIMMLVAGAFIGGRGFTANFVSDLLLPVLCSYGIVGLLCLLACWGSFTAFAAMLGLATVGIFSSAGFSLLLLRFFPPEAEDESDG